MDYVANVDLNNWPALYQQFTPNALIDASDSLPGGLGPVFDGRDQFIAFNTLVVHCKLGVNAWGWSAWPQCGAASPRPPAQHLPGQAHIDYTATPPLSLLNILPINGVRSCFWRRSRHMRYTLARL